MTSIRVSRNVEIPDLLRITRYKKLPELGPRILFFSGGSAINGVCQVLKEYTHNSIHLVTPFDSGGSSATLRKAFHMPAMGDVRNRLMALADETVLGHPEVYELFNYRMPKNKTPDALLAMLTDMANGKSPLVTDINNPMRQLIRHQLGYFLAAMPTDFDLRGASIGNLILAGGYLNNHKHLDPIVFLFSKLVNVQGIVRAIVNKDVHLAANLADGSCVIGQHRITGKEVAPLTSPVVDLFLSESIDEAIPTSVQIRKKNRKLIDSADLICYPPGSFYTSLIANLLPKGVGTAVHQNTCPKVYIPNLGSDPEQLGMSFEQTILTLLQQLQSDLSSACSYDQLLNFVLIDSKNGRYPYPIPQDILTSLGIHLIDTNLVSKRSAPYYDNELLVSALLSLC